MTAVAAPSLSAMHAFRLWTAVILSMLAVLSISLSTPSHLLEHTIPTAHDTVASYDGSTVAKAAPAPIKGKATTQHGHVCAAHCAAHVVTQPPALEALGFPPVMDASWPSPAIVWILAGAIFAPERPPRV